MKITAPSDPTALRDSLIAEVEKLATRTFGERRRAVRRGESVTELTARFEALCEVLDLLKSYKETP
jgi:hypothetical protein